MNGLEKIDVQMTYVNLDTEEIRQFFWGIFFLRRSERLVSETYREYHKWVSFRLKWEEKIEMRL